MLLSKDPGIGAPNIPPAAFCAPGVKGEAIVGVLLNNSGSSSVDPQMLEEQHLVEVLAVFSIGCST